MSQLHFDGHCSETVAWFRRLTAIRGAIAVRQWIGSRRLTAIRCAIVDVIIGTNLYIVVVNDSAVYRNDSHCQQSGILRAYTHDTRRGTCVHTYLLSRQHVCSQKHFGERALSQESPECVIPDPFLFRFHRTRTDALLIPSRPNPFWDTHECPSLLVMK